MLPGFIVRTLNFDGIKLSICVLTYERHEVATGKRQAATGNGSGLARLTPDPPVAPWPTPSPPHSPSVLVTEPEAVNEAQNLK